MLSFGIEYERAFSTAFCNARFPAGSGPPSLAATMIARVSFEKSWPRFASAAPFLCLIDDHLLCPDMSLPPYDREEALVHALDEDADLHGEIVVGTTPLRPARAAARATVRAGPGRTRGRRRPAGPPT